jgi:FkbM family methyltransferase
MLKLDRRSNLYELGIHAVSLGLRPSTVIDVGAATGTLELMSAFPKSKFLLIEPLSEHKYKLNSLHSAYDVDVVIGAASDKDGLITLNVHPHQLDGSSVLREEMGEHTDGYRREVPCLRIDNYFKRNGYLGDVLLKVDVQGAELSVIE